MVTETEISITYESAPPEHAAHVDPRHDFWTLPCLPNRHLTKRQAFAGVSIACALSVDEVWLRALIPEWAAQLDISVHDAKAAFGSGVSAARRWAAALDEVAQ